MVVFAAPPKSPHVPKPTDGRGPGATDVFMTTMARPRLRAAARGRARGVVGAFSGAVGEGAA